MLHLFQTTMKIGIVIETNETLINVQSWNAPIQFSLTVSSTIRCCVSYANGELFSLSQIWLISLVIFSVKLFCSRGMASAVFRLHWLEVWECTFRQSHRSSYNFLLLKNQWLQCPQNDKLNLESSLHNSNRLVFLHGFSTVWESLTLTVLDIPAGL